MRFGVPVYNGAQLLDGSLACLARQTFRDFQVLIFDNASTDATAEIARGWAARDPRFHYIRQPSNVGGMINARDVLLAADTKWFMWRADDDLSDDNYLEALYALASQSPGCKLAASTAVLVDWDLSVENVIEPPAGLDPNSIGGRIRALLASGPPWYYGLWDRETLRSALLGVLENFPYPFASDHLTLYGPIAEGGLRVTSATRMIMRVRRAPKAKGQGGRASFADHVGDPARLHAQSAPHALRAGIVAGDAPRPAGGPALSTFAIACHRLTKLLRCRLARCLAGPVKREHPGMFSATGERKFALAKEEQGLIGC